MKEKGAKMLKTRREDGLWGGASRGLAALVAALCVLSLWPGALEAKKKKKIELVIAYVSPNVKAGAACQNRLGSAMRKDNDTLVNTTSKSTIVGRLGLTSRTFDDAWFDLPNERFLKARELKGTGEDSEDAVLLISCDVDEPRLRIVVISGKKSVKRLSIEGVPQDLPVLKAASIFMLRAAYIGFNK